MSQLLQGSGSGSRIVPSTVSCITCGLFLFLAVAAFVASDGSQSTDRFLTGWPLLICFLWGVASLALSLARGLVSLQLARFFSLLCLFGSFLSFVSFVCFVVSVPRAPAMAAAAHFLACAFIYVLWNVFAVPSELKRLPRHALTLNGVGLTVLCVAVILLVGMTAQSVHFATRFRGEVPQVERPLLGDGTNETRSTRLFVKCKGAHNSTTIATVLIIPELDHTSVFYEPLMQALLDSAPLAVCLYDSAGSGFSDAGDLPRSTSALGREAALVAKYVTHPSSLNSTTRIVVASGQAALTATSMLTEPGMRSLFNGGLVLLDALTPFDAAQIGAALHMTEPQYVEHITRPLVSSYNWEHFSAALGSCLLRMIQVPSRFPTLPSQYRGLQKRARCNGGMQAKASASTARALYSDLANATRVLQDTPLLIMASGGPLKGPNPLAVARKQVQELMYGLSSSALLQIVDESRKLGDLPVKHVQTVAQAIVAFVSPDQHW